MKPRAEIKCSRDRALYCDGWDRGKAFGHGKISNALAWRRLRARIKKAGFPGTAWMLNVMTEEAKRAGRRYEKQYRESAS